MSKVKIDREDFTASAKDTPLYFLTHEFKDGCFLGFWSTSPWGRVHDQDRGWVVISAKGEVLDSIQTFDWGSVYHFGDSYAAWRKRQKEEHGPARRLLDEMTGEQKWKMERG
jgi:hypothetical protein